MIQALLLEIASRSTRSLFRCRRKELRLASGPTDNKISGIFLQGLGCFVNGRGSELFGLLFLSKGNIVIVNHADERDFISVVVGHNVPR